MYTSVRNVEGEVMHGPNFVFTKPFFVQTDASDRGIGAVLSQLDTDGTDHPVLFYSRKLLSHEERYAMVEKECLAICDAVKVYLLGHLFTIQTDHRTLEWLKKLKDNNARLTRWSLALQPFEFKVTYRKGRNADGLSQAFPSSSPTLEKEGGVSGN